MAASIEGAGIHSSGRRAAAGPRRAGRPVGPHTTRFAWVGAAMLAAAGTAALDAHGADVRVLCPSALRAPVLELARSYAREQGHRVEFIFASVAAIHKRIATGERADLAIGTAQGVDALVRLGRGVDDTQAPLVRSAVGIALRPGATGPALDNAEALAQWLRGVESIAQPDPGLAVPGGAQVAELLQRLGLTDELKARTRFVADVREVARRVAAGSAEIGLAVLGDIVAASGVTVIGPVSEPATEGVAYAAVVVRGAPGVERARAFIAHLRGPGAGSVFRKAGYTPID